MKKALIISIAVAVATAGVIYAGGFRCFACQGSGFQGNFPCVFCAGTGHGYDY